VPLFLTAIVLGFAYAAIPGPVTTESIRRAAHSGFRSGFAVQAGSLIGDGVWALIGLTGVAILLRNEIVGTALGLAGAGLMLWLTKEVVQSAFFPNNTTTSTLQSGNALHIGLAFGLANPAGIAFWSGLGASIFGSAAPSPSEVVTLVACFLIGATAWGVVISWVVAWGSTRAGHRLMRIVDIVSAVVLGWFGVRLLLDTLPKLRTVSAPLVRALI